MAFSPHDPQLVIAQGRYGLRFSLSALAEIETGLDVAGLQALSERLGNLTAHDLNVVLVALLRAGGADEPEIIAASAHPGSAAQAVLACLKAHSS